MFNEEAGAFVGDDDSSDIEIPTVNIAHRGRAARKTPGLLDKLTKDVTSIYNELTSQNPATSAERADLHLTQQLDRMESMADEMLDRLAEYCELLEHLRSNTSTTLNKNLPKTFEAVQEMNEVYRRIDYIEGVVRTAEGLTDGLENSVIRAENELTPSKSAAIKGFFRNLSPFVLPKSKNTDSWVHLDHQEAPVFSLSELIRDDTAGE